MRALDVVLVFGSVGGLLAAIAAVRALAAKFGWKPEVARKAVHIATGVFAMTLPWIFATAAPVVLLVALAVLAMLWMRLPSQRLGGVGSALHAVSRKSWGDLVLALAIGFLFINTFASGANQDSSTILYVLPLAVITLSDSAAALAGSAYGRRIFAVEDGAKSVEGVAVFFVVTWLVAIIALLLGTQIGRAEVVALGFAVAAFGALVEADSWNGLDNAFVPIALHLYLRANQHDDLAVIAAQSASLLAAVLLFARLAPAMGLTRHAARGCAIVTFTLAALSGWAAAIPAAAALGAHLYARRRRPCRSRYPDLDFVAVFAGSAALWLFVGEWSGPTAIHYFMLAWTTAFLAYVTLGARKDLLAATLTALIAGVAFAALIQVRPDAGWHGRGILIVAASSLVLAGAATFFAPRLFDRWRAPRVALLSGVVPMAAYLLKAL